MTHDTRRQKRNETHDDTDRRHDTWHMTQTYDTWHTDDTHTRHICDDKYGNVMLYPANDDHTTYGYIKGYGAVYTNIHIYILTYNNTYHWQSFTIQSYLIMRSTVIAILGTAYLAGAAAYEAQGQPGKFAIWHSTSSGSQQQPSYRTQTMYHTQVSWAAEIDQALRK